MKFYCLLIFYLLSFIYCHSQGNSYQKENFASPLDIPLVLAGNFGELRPNHFHSGIDIKTQGVEGKKVFSVASGYVSRIKISTGGYGKALYIKHPNGYISVYAHLKNFNDEIESFVKKNQYLNKSFEIELFPNSSELKVERGDLIAISGNSGGSRAPHLHFEIRDSNTEYPINPLLFNFSISDHKPPIVRSISVYPLDDKSFVNGVNKRLDVSATKVGNVYKLTNNQVPKVHGNIGLGIETYDLLDAAGNHCGVYSIKLSNDYETFYEHQLEKFSFYESRYMNAHIDYSKYVRTNRKTQRSYLLPNNRLSIYENLIHSGRLEITDDGVNNLKFEVLDVAGNKSTVELSLQHSKPGNESYSEKIEEQAVAYFKWNEKNTYQNDEVILYLPKGVLYEDLAFNFSIGDTMADALVPSYRIHNESVPLHSYIILSIKNTTIPLNLRSKCLVMSYTEKDGWYAEGGTWKGDYIVLKTRSFGSYTIMADIKAPVITPINIKEGQDMSGKWSIMVKIEDNLSGIDDYYATVDGKWILMEYDKKANRLTHLFDEKISPGRHHFKLIVRDEVGNTSEYEADFIR